MNIVDEAALELCIRTAMMNKSMRSHVESMLKDRPFVEVAKFASYSCQYDALNLQPWDVAPCDADENIDDGAGKLLRRMLAAGISRFHPDPLAALDRPGALARRR